MNWIRRKLQPRLRAIALARTVLPVPGTSSIRRWPRQSSATRASRTSWCLPTITRSTLARTFSPVCSRLVIRLLGESRCHWSGFAEGCQLIVRRRRRMGSERDGRADCGSRRRDDVCAAARQRDPADDERHHAADEAHRREEELAADERRDGTAAEQGGHDDRDGRQPDPFEGRPALALDRRRADVRRRSASSRRRPVGRRSAHRSAGRSWRHGIEIRLHQRARERRRPRPSPAPALDEDRDRDLRIVRRGEPDEPRVRLARAAELRRAGLAGRRDAGHLGARA